MVKADSWP